MKTSVRKLVRMISRGCPSIKWTDAVKRIIIIIKGPRLKTEEVKKTELASTNLVWFNFRIK